MPIKISIKRSLPRSSVPLVKKHEKRWNTSRWSSSVILSPRSFTRAAKWKLRVIIRRSIFLHQSDPCRVTGLRIDRSRSRTSLDPCTTLFSSKIFSATTFILISFLFHRSLTHTRNIVPCFIPDTRDPSSSPIFASCSFPYRFFSTPDPKETPIPWLWMETTTRDRSTTTGSVPVQASNNQRGT